MKKISQDFKMWFATVFISIPLLEVLMYFLMQGKDLKTGQFFVVPEREPLMWGMGFFFVVVITILLGLMSLAQKEQEKNIKKNGEDNPYFTRNYENGKVLAYRNSIKFIRGSNQILITYPEFLSLSKAIEKAHDEHVLLTNPLPPMDLIRKMNDTALKNKEGKPIYVGDTIKLDNPPISS